MGVVANESNAVIKAPMTTLMGSTRTVVTFDDLWLGDRFQPLYAVGTKYPVYTKIRHDQARCHSPESRAMKKSGWGYLGDPIVSVETNEKVKFLPFE